MSFLAGNVQRTHRVLAGSALEEHLVKGGLSSVAKLHIKLCRRSRGITERVVERSATATCGLGCCDLRHARRRAEWARVPDAVFHAKLLLHASSSYKRDISIFLTYYDQWNLR
jgi:hypothetical protein